MKFAIMKICALAFLANVLALEPQKSQVDSKQEKRSLSHDDWSSSAVGAGLESGDILPGEAASSIGISTHTDTLTTVREKVPIAIPTPVHVPIDRPYPVEVIKTIPQPYAVPFPVHHVKTIRQPFPVEVVKHVPVEVIKHIDRPIPVPYPIEVVK